MSNTGSSVRNGASRIASAVTPEVIRRRYVAKFVAAMLVVVLILSTVGAAAYIQTQQTVESDAKDGLKSSVSLQANSLSEWAGAKQAQAKSVSADTETFDTADDSTIRAKLITDRNRLGGDVAAIHYIDISSQSVISTAKSVNNTTLSGQEKPWANESIYSTELAGSDNVWTSHETHNGSSNTSVASFASLTTSAEGAVVVIGSLEFQAEQTLNQSATRSTSLVNDQNEVILSGTGGGENPVKTTDIDFSQIREGGQGVGGDLAAYEAQSNTAYAYTEVDKTPWVMVTSTPTDEAFAVRDTVGLSVGAIVILGLVGLLVVGVVLGRNTVVPLTNLQTKAEQMEQGNLDVDLETTRKDEIGQLYTGFGAMRDSLRERIEEARSATQEAETERARAQDLATHLETKADEYSTVMGAVAAGDFTRRMDRDEENEAMDEIARNFNEMILAIEETTHRVKQFANQVALSSQEVTASSEEVGSASQQVSESIEEIADDADRQNEQLQSVSSEMDQLSLTTEEIAASSTAVADIAQQTAETGQEGQTSAQQAIDNMTDLEDDAEDAVEAIENLEDEMAQIDELIDFITDIAEQTNMLALNANIEASRSGSGGENSGEGFAVVANEIKELSRETKEAASSIEERLEQIQDQTERTAQEVQMTSSQIAANTDSVRETVEALDAIAGYSEETYAGIQEISSATEQQADTTGDVVEMVDDAAEISEETAQESQTVNQVADAQTVAITQVSESASELAEQASQLSDTLEQFDVDPDEAAAFAFDAGPADGGDATADESAAEDRVATNGAEEQNGELDSGPQTDGGE